MGFYIPWYALTPPKPNKKPLNAHIHTVLLPVSEFVHGHRQMCGKLSVAGVDVVVILRQQVNIMQEDAAPVFISESLPHSNIQQLGSVKSTVPPLNKRETGVNTQLHMNALILKQ